MCFKPIWSHGCSRPTLLLIKLRKLYQFVFNSLLLGEYLWINSLVLVTFEKLHDCLYVILTPKFSFHLVTLEQFSYSPYFCSKRWHLFTVFSFILCIYNSLPSWKFQTRLPISLKLFPQNIYGKEKPTFDLPPTTVAHVWTFPIVRSLTNTFSFFFLKRLSITQLSLVYVSVVSESWEKECLKHTIVPQSSMLFEQIWEPITTSLYSCVTQIL